MRLILIGPPGSGKGTQAKRLAERQHLSHFGMGDLLREAISQGTEAGTRAAPFVSSGQLVPDAVVNDMVAERFARPDRPTQFVMDGYPRTRSQAVAFDKVLAANGLGLDAAVQLVVDDDEIVQRLGHRLICPGCHTPYHAISKAPRTPGVCDECRTRLEQRVDDRPETVRRRLQVYHENNRDLLAYYRERGLLREVRGQGNIEDIYKQLLRAVTGG